MVLYLAVIVSFFLFGINAGLSGSSTQTIEIVLGLVVAVLLITVIFQQGLLSTIVTGIAGLVAGRIGYSLSPGLR